jgi:GDP/UDP-N,N'-diacetylbacillosamine 2-epimerase (hydrolysing)
LRRAAKRQPLHLFTNVERSVYLNLLRNAQFLIGNSSSGMVEASYFPVPVINVGTRQNGRERGINVIDTLGTAALLATAIHKAMTLTFKQAIATPRSPYGLRPVGPAIASILAKLQITPRWLQKKLNYVL